MKKGKLIFLVFFLLLFTRILPVLAQTQEITVSSIQDLQSTHNYIVNIDKTWIYQIKEANSIELIFSTKTYVEEDYDFIYITDTNKTTTYTGNQLAGQKILISGDTVRIRLVSDSTDTGYGFKVDAANPIILNSLKIQGHYAYYDTSAGAVIAQYNSSDGNVVIPSFLGNKPVIGIWAGFSGKETLVSITIPASVFLLYDGCFQNNPNLVSAFFRGNTPQKLGNNLFTNSSSSLTISYYQGASGYTKTNWGSIPLKAVSCNFFPSVAQNTLIESSGAVSGDISFQVANNTSAAKGAELYLTIYSADGRILKLLKQQSTLKKGTNTLTFSGISFSTPSPSQPLLIKLLTWETTGILQPVTQKAYDKISSISP